MSSGTEIPVTFERLGAKDVVATLGRALGHVESLLGSMADDTIEARIVPGGGIKPVPPPPPLASGCHPASLVEWLDLSASEAFARLAPYILALLRALEARDLLESPLRNVPGVLPPHPPQP